MDMDYLNWFERRDLNKLEKEVWALHSKLVNMKEATKLYWCRNEYSGVGCLHALKMAIDPVLAYEEDKE